jgi:hypothetical protein
MVSRAGTPEQQQQGLTPAEYHELQLAASAADKHPVTWRSMRDKVWCEVGGSCWRCSCCPLWSKCMQLFQTAQLMLFVMTRVASAERKMHLQCDRYFPARF